jgi:hypothetical protein
MIDSAGWFDWAVRDPGPADRWANFGFAHTSMVAITHHSLEGFLRPLFTTGYSPMKDAARFPTAWHGSILREDTVILGKLYRQGTLFQHYPVFARLQHGNSANTLGPGFESEDYAMPGNTVRLTPGQSETWLRIHRDMREFTGRDFKRVPGSQRGLVEHREMTVPPGLTTCPNNLYDELWARIAQGDDAMTPEEKADYDALKAKVARMEGITAIVADMLGGEPPANSTNAWGDRLAALGRIKGQRVFDQIANQNAALTSHRASHGALSLPTAPVQATITFEPPATP